MKNKKKVMFKKSKTEDEEIKKEDEASNNQEQVDKKVSVKDILIAENYVSVEDMEKAEKFSKENKTPISSYLLNEGLITKDLLGQAVAEFFKVEYSDLNSYLPGKEQVLEIPEEIAKKFKVVVFKKSDNSVVVATDNPTQKGLIEALKVIFPKQAITLTYSLIEDIENTFTHYRKTLETRFGKIIKEDGRVAPQIIDEIIEDALILNASDIHFEPQVDIVVIRFRVDGVLQEVGRIPKTYYDNMLNRIKVQANLRTDEHASAQDGAIHYENAENTADIRVSMVPILDGEKVVMRILSKYVRGFNLSSLGLSAENERILNEAVKKPFGMILVVGPTGSGKTTTLYSLIRMLNRTEVNIATIEDPVEYKIQGINQIQVNKETNLTFSQGLRSIVRQDPDIILVGEIRDDETVEISVNAALTGHLLFSTFHANDAETAIPRLLDMKIEPFLLASTIELIIAQRLVRRICENCRYSYLEKKQTFYKGKGCDVCNNTGYKGRIAIFEFIQVTQEMQDLVLKHPSSNEIWKLAKKQGSKTLFEDGMENVKNGTTTLEELRRVAAE
ncbi:MAG: GspE/PulE family protein [Candidatus Moraniibacteriota bacterium]